MLNHKQIELRISEAEQEFKCCWSMLETLCNGKAEKAEAVKVAASFQPTLGRALYAVEVLHQKVCKEGRELVARRSSLTRSGFRRRLHALNGFKQLLRQCADVGRALGDAYAWCFYQNERELLRRHHEQEPNPHPPIGVGGMGEIEFVKRFPILGNCLVIAHTTTTFLRLGDFSLIDLATSRVAAIGELKSCASGDTELNISVNLVGPNPRRFKLPESWPVNADKTKASTPLPLDLQERLKRQISRIQESFKPVKSDGAVGTHEIVGDFHNGKLAELYARCSDTGCEYIEGDRGLLLLGVRRHGETLYARLTAGFAAKRNFKRLRIEEPVRKMVDKSLPHNSVRIDWVHYRARQRYALKREMRPLFWWPIPPDIVEALLFKRFAVMTIYNPAFMIADLRRAGVEVTSDNENGFRIWKKSGEKRFEVYGMPYFLELVQSELLSDGIVVSLIQKMVQSSEAADFKSSATVHLNLNFVW